MPLAISDELFSSAPTDNLQVQTGAGGGDTTNAPYSNTLTAEHLANNNSDRVPTTGSPAGSVASGSAFSEGLRYSGDRADV